MLERLIQLDKNLFIWLNSHHSPFWDKLMWLISGKIEWLPLYLLLIGFIIYRFRWKSIPIILAIVLTITLADQIAVKAFKVVFERLRPSHNSEFEGIIHLVKDYHGGRFGFVSNHAANSFGLATIMSLIFRNKYFSPGILLWAALVSYSRIYLGVHYPADIIGGAILGAGLGSLVYFLLGKFLSSKLYTKKGE